MTKEASSVLEYMSERLKQKPYISNPNSKDLLAEVATVIIHILLDDGKYDLQIDNSFNIFKDRVFDYSVKKIETTRNLAYFKDKDDTEIAKAFLDMLNLHFNKEEIRTLVQLFDEIDTMDNDYQFKFKKKETDTNIQEMRDNDNANKIKTSLIYPNQNIESKLSELFNVSETAIIREDTLLKEINNLLYSHAWVNAYDLFGDIQYIIYIQKKLAESKKQPIQYDVLKAFESKQNVFFTSHKKSLHLETRQDARKSLRNIWFSEYSIVTVIKIGRLFEAIESIKKDGIIVVKDYETTKPADIKYDAPLKAQHDKTEEDIEYIEKQKDAPTLNSKKQSVRKDNVSNLLDLYNDSKKKIIEEPDIINLHKQLIRNKAWMNIADCISSIAYILIRQSQLINPQRGLSLNKLKYLFLDCIYLINSDIIKFKNDNHENNRELVRSKLLQQYGIKKLIEFYNSIIRLYTVNDDGTIVFGETENETPKYTRDDSKSEMILSETNQTNKLLADLYKDSENFIINEQRIIDLHSQLVNSREWSNISQCIASIAYVLIRQIDFANSPRGLKYVKMKSLFRKCVDIHAQDSLVFDDGNHLHNIEIVEERLIKQYGIDLLIDFFKRIIGTYDVAADGTFIFEESKGKLDEEKKPEENISVQNDTEDDSDDDYNDGTVEKEEDNKKPQEPSTDIPEFDRKASYNEDGTNILLAKLEAYSNNSSIKEIFQYYFLDIQESFSHVRTKGELFEAYQHFKEYTAINFISKTQKEKLMEAFRCYIYDLLGINKK